MWSDYDAMLVLAGLALLATTLGLRVLNKLGFPKFFVYFPVGLILGPYVLGLTPEDPLELIEVFERVTEFAVIVSLVVAGLKIGRPLRWREWRSTSRLVLLVMPLSIAAVALTGHLALGLALGPAILLGAILAPTDPVLAGAVQLERPSEDDELKFGLTSEAGLNDGFAFPFVYLGLYLTTRADEMPGLFAYWVFTDLLYAVALGLVAGWLVGHVGGRWVLKRAEEEAISRQRRELIPLALLLVAYGAVQILGGYGFLAAFASGLGFRAAIGEKHEKLRQFEDASTLLESLAELVTVVFLGALFRLHDVLGLGWGGLALAAAAIFVLRPAIVWVSTMRSGFPTRERVYWSWFGIRGIGSLYYMSYAVAFGLPHELAITLFAATTLVVLASNLLHGATVYPGVRRLQERWLVQT